jgi:hypothetical protein
MNNRVCRATSEKSVAGNITARFFATITCGLTEVVLYFYVVKNIHVVSATLVARG